MSPSVRTILKQSALVAGAFVLFDLIYALTIGQVEYQGAVLVHSVPLKGELVDQWQAGTVPLWTSLVGAGHPIFADGASFPFDPRHLLFLPFDDIDGYIAVEMLTRAVSAAVTFAYLRVRIGASAWPSFLGTLLFCSSTVWFEEGTAFTTGALLMPGYFWLCERLYEHITAPRVIAVAGAWGWFVLFNSPVYAPFLAIACVAWPPLVAAFRARAVELRPVLRYGAAYCGAVAVGLALAAVVVLPFTELGALSNRGGEYPEDPLALKSLLSAFVGANPPSPLYPAGVYFFYVGVISFAPIAVALRRRSDPYVAAAAAFGLTAAALILLSFVGKPVLVDLMPALASVTLFRMTFLIGFAAAVLVTIGLDRSSWEFSALPRWTLRGLFLAQASILIALAVLGFVLLTMRYEDAAAYATLRPSVDALWPGVITLVLIGIRALGLGASVAQPSDGSTLRVKRRKVSRVAAVGTLLAAELLLAWGVARVRTGVPYDLGPEGAYLQRVTGPDGRAMEILPRPEWDTPALPGGVDSFALVQNAPAANEIPTANIYASLISRDYSDTFEAFGDLDFRTETFPRGPKAYAITTRFDSPLVRALGVSHLYSTKAFPSPKRSRQVLAGDRYFVYEVKDPLPRAFFAGQARWRPREEVFDELAAVSEDDPGSARLGPEVVLEGDERVEGAPAYAPARVVSDTGSRVEVEVTAPTEGYLVLSDVMVPGWTATVDGEEAEIEKANGFARAVRVPVGEHIVAFEFEPTTLDAGLAISGGTAVACLAVLGWSAVRRRKRPAEPVPEAPPSHRPG